MSTPRYEVQTGSGKSAYVTCATATRFTEAWAEYAKIHTPGRKRLLRNGVVLVRDRGDDQQQTINFEEAT